MKTVKLFALTLSFATLAVIAAESASAAAPFPIGMKRWGWKTPGGERCHITGMSGMKAIVEPTIGDKFKDNSRYQLIEIYKLCDSNAEEKIKKLDPKTAVASLIKESGAHKSAGYDRTDDVTAGPVHEPLAGKSTRITK
jgi:hypothetical protein